MSEASLAFQILFATSNSFQGFFLFLFFCVLNKDARKSWKKILLRGHHKRPIRSSHLVSRSKDRYTQISSNQNPAVTELSARGVVNGITLEGSDQISTCSEVVEIYFIEEIPDISPRDTSPGSVVSVIENHHADCNGHSGSPVDMVGVCSHQQATHSLSD